MIKQWVVEKRNSEFAVGSHLTGNLHAQDMGTEKTEAGHHKYHHAVGRFPPLNLKHIALVSFL